MNNKIINSPLYADLLKDVEALRTIFLLIDKVGPDNIEVSDPIERLTERKRELGNSINKDKKLGYIPRDKNEILSRLMDAGKLIYGTVYKKERIGKWLKITIRIFLSD